MSQPDRKKRGVSTSEEEVQDVSSSCDVGDSDGNNALQLPAHRGSTGAEQQEARPGAQPQEPSEQQGDSAQLLWTRSGTLNINSTNTASPSSRTSTLADSLAAVLAAASTTNKTSDGSFPPHVSEGGTGSSISTFLLNHLLQHVSPSPQTTASSSGGNTTSSSTSSAASSSSAVPTQLSDQQQDQELSRSAHSNGGQEMSLPLLPRPPDSADPDIALKMLQVALMQQEEERRRAEQEGFFELQRAIFGTRPAGDGLSPANSMAALPLSTNAILELLAALPSTNVLLEQLQASNAMQKFATGASFPHQPQRVLVAPPQQQAESLRTSALSTLLQQDNSPNLLLQELLARTLLSSNTPSTAATSSTPLMLPSQLPILRMQETEGFRRATSGHSSPHPPSLSSSDKGGKDDQERKASTSPSKYPTATTTTTRKSRLHHGMKELDDDVSPSSTKHTTKKPRTIRGLTGRPPISLATDADKHCLSPYQALLREQIELFETIGADLGGKAQGRNVPILLGQVGIRCRYCARVPPAKRSSGSVLYTKTYSGIYQISQNMCKTHFLAGCQNIPASTRSQLQELRDKLNRGSGGKQFWSDSLHTVGVVEDNDCLRFSVDPPRALLAKPQLEGQGGSTGSQGT